MASPRRLPDMPLPWNRHFRKKSKKLPPKSNRLSVWGCYPSFFFRKSEKPAQPKEPLFSKRSIELAPFIIQPNGKDRADCVVGRQTLSLQANILMRSQAVIAGRRQRNRFRKTTLPEETRAIDRIFEHKRHTREPGFPLARQRQKQPARKNRRLLHSAESPPMFRTLDGPFLGQ